MTKPFATSEIAAATAIRAVSTAAIPRQTPELRAAGPSQRDLSELIGRLYDASLAPSLWAGTLADLSGYVGGHAAALLSKDSSAPAASLHVHDGGMDPERIAAYFGTYVRMDMHSLAHCLGEIGQPIVSSEIVDPE